MVEANSRLCVKQKEMVVSAKSSREVKLERLRTNTEIGKVKSLVTDLTTVISTNATSIRIGTIEQRKRIEEVKTASISNC